MEKPQLKQMLVPFIKETGSGIRFGGHQANLTRDIDVDDPEVFYEFLKLLDGTRTTSVLAKAIGSTKENVEEILESLKTASIIFENNIEGLDFTKDEEMYYSRNINFYAWIDVEGKYYNYWEVQEILKKSHILLLGAGGTGSSCARSLARMGVGEITIVDYDTIELSNLNRQEYIYENIGDSKIQSINKHLKDINPFIKINPYEKEINSIDDLDSIDNSYDLVILSIDQPANIYEVIEEYAERKGIPWVLGGYASTIITRAIYYPGDTKHSDIVNSSIDEHYEARQIQENDHWKWENAILSPVAQIAGNLSALYAFYYLTKLQNIEGSVIDHLDLFNIQNSDFTYTIKKGNLSSC